MLGLSTFTELRLGFYALVAISAAGWLLYERHHLVSEGRQQVEAADKAARTAQEAKDAAIHSQVVSQLQSDNEALRAAASQPAASIVCRPKVRYVSAVSPGGTVSVAGPDKTGAGTGGMPQGDAGVDLGVPLRDVALADTYLDGRRDTLADWAVKQAQDTSR